MLLTVGQAALLSDKFIHNVQACSATVDQTATITLTVRKQATATVDQTATITKTVATTAATATVTHTPTVARTVGKQATATTITLTSTLTPTPTWRHASATWADPIATWADPIATWTGEQPDTALHIGSPIPKWTATPIPGDTMQISSASLEYVRLHVTATTGGQPFDPRSLNVEMAFPAPGIAPIAGDWKTATWDYDTVGSTVRYLAQCLVGPGGTVTLPVGAYDAYIRATSLPEVPVLRSPRQLVVAP